MRMMKPLAALVMASASVLALSACGGGSNTRQAVLEEVSGGVNPYLWRASLDTLSFLPITSTDTTGGVILFDWKSFPESPDERMKATVFILDTRLRADGVTVQIFRQERVNGEWRDAVVDPDTGPQIESQILSRARALRVAELS
jgi:hypothetical protein